jgi:uncharacterized protein
MSADIQRQFIRQYIQAQRIPEVNLAWQGGEPTLMGLEFFQRTVNLADQYKKYGIQVNHAIQTNGILLDDQWCEFLHVNHFLVGISLDGPKPMHDAYRVDKGGQPTFSRVIKAVRLLKKHQVDFNILCTLHAANANYPVEVYRFFRDEVGAQYIQFIPIVERLQDSGQLNDNNLSADKEINNTPSLHRLYIQQGNKVSDRSITAAQFGNFMVKVFDEWIQKDVGRIFVQLFDVSLANWIGAPPGLCVHSETCGNALALEHNGDLYACDHFVEPNFLLGNIKESNLVDLVGSQKQRKFGVDKRDTLPRYCRECPVKFACHGGCPKDRFINTPDGEPGLNYLCEGYRQFFSHIDEAMKFMANEIQHKRPPSNVIAFMRSKKHL